VRILDAPLAFLDPVNDAVCSCTYPRCFAGKLVSQYSIMSPEGEGLKLKGLLKIGGTHAKVDELFPALEAKLKRCCEIKTRAYIDYAREKCGEKQLGEVCASTPNGYEPRFDGEGLGADMHFPKKPCVAVAWAKFETMAVVDKNTFAQRQAQLLKCADDAEGVKKASNGRMENCAAVAGQCNDEVIGEVVREHCPKTCNVKCSTALRLAEVELEDALAGKAAARHGWADDATPTPTESPQVHAASSISGMCEF